MKIVSWNCNGALRKKTSYLDELEADILVVQECENPVHSSPAFKQWAGNHLWIGKTRNRGLGIFARNGHTISALAWKGEYQLKQFNNSPSLIWNGDNLQSFLPCMINDCLTLLAVWTKQANSPNFQYIGQLWKYLQIHKSRLSRKNFVLCGDLNSNAIWDEPDRWWNHSDVVKELEELKIHSLYHFLRRERQGQETQKTYFMHRKLEHPYHIDYFFVSDDLIDKCTLEIGNYSEWISHSDHVPLTMHLRPSSNISLRSKNPI